jgi:hypothetical protein
LTGNQSGDPIEHVLHLLQDERSACVAAITATLAQGGPASTVDDYLTRIEAINMVLMQVAATADQAEQA